MGYFLNPWNEPTSIWRNDLPFIAFEYTGEDESEIAMQDSRIKRDNSKRHQCMNMAYIHKLAQFSRPISPDEKWMLNVNWSNSELNSVFIIHNHRLIESRGETERMKLSVQKDSFHNELHCRDFIF